MTEKISPKHPRYESLRFRELLVSGYSSGIVAASGLIAHGRGEAFDYFLGEETIEPAAVATRAAAAALILAEKPVISVNGNSAILVAKELVELADLCGAPLEVNLFHPSAKRRRAIEEMLEKAGAKEVLGIKRRKLVEVRGVASSRRDVDREGIFEADTVLIPLEDGDRAEALRRLGKKIIAIDLNPLSRTARYASITIVDNVVRALPNLIKNVKKMKRMKRKVLEEILGEFDNKENLRASMRFILDRLSELSGKGSTFFEVDESKIEVGM